MTLVDDIPGWRAEATPFIAVRSPQRALRASHATAKVTPLPGAYEAPV